MDPLLLTIGMRAIERLVIVLAGAGAIYLGYRLFLAMPNRDRSSGKLELPGGVSIFLSRVGPGVFFSLFGATVIAMALHYGVSLTDQAKLIGEVTMAQAEAASAAASPASSKRKTVYSGLVDAAATGDARSNEADRVSAALTIRNLNRAMPALRDGLAPTQRLDILQAVRDAKLRMMRAAWHEPSWGPYARFSAWIDAGEPDPPPADIQAAAAVFRAGLTAEGTAGK